MRLLRFATTNPHKVREVRDLLAGVPVQVETLAGLPAIPEPEETDDTFEGNARLKARYYAAHLPRALVVSEDSGLEIDALGGAPGVHSARFLGPDATYATRFDEILRRLEGVPDQQRTARFVCAMAVADGDRIVFETRGVVEGTIAAAPDGDGGFGYDPIFFSPQLGCTLARAGDAKAAVSHRAQAVAALSRWARDLK
jgi:XTP/dITP diphosphohydrolase